MKVFEINLDTGEVLTKEVPCIQNPHGRTVDTLESWKIDSRTGFIAPEPFAWVEDRPTHAAIMFGTFCYVAGEIYVIFFDEHGQVRSTTLCGELGWLNHTERH